MSIPTSGYPVAHIKQDMVSMKVAPEMTGLLVPMNACLDVCMATMIAANESSIGSSISVTSMSIG